jgi:hypothetical protein
MRRGLQSFTFAFSDGVSRTFYGWTYELALEHARSWGNEHGGLEVVENSRIAA